MPTGTFKDAVVMVHFVRIFLIVTPVIVYNCSRCLTQDFLDNNFKILTMVLIYHLFLLLVVLKLRFVSCKKAQK